MSNHARVAGRSYLPVTIAGREYRLCPLTIGDYADLEARTIAARPNFLSLAAAACRDMPPEVGGPIIAAAFDRSVMQSQQALGRDEIERYTNTFQGKATVFWLMLRRHHPEITGPREALELIDQMAAENGWAAIDQIFAQMNAGSGEADLKNSSGQSTAALAPEAIAAPAGQASTNSSPNGMAGHPPPSTN